MQYFIAEQRDGLTEETVSDLLKQRGYAMTTPFGHVHATDGQRELHICRLDELPSMETAQFLTRFSDALAWLSFLDEASGFHERNALFANTSKDRKWTNRGTTADAQVGK